MNNNPIYSNLASDEDFREMLGLYVNEMPERTARFQQELAAKNWSALHIAVHQLKGSAGSYGFAEISQAAAALDTMLKTEQPEEQIAAATQNLIDLCRRAVGVPQ